jgi:predicted  nucleic acid-binding Zn ribbon protein
MGNQWMHWENLPIKCEEMLDNETWNTCPDCGKNWKDEIAIPGLLHRTRLCKECREKDKDGPKS